MMTSEKPVKRLFAAALCVVIVLCLASCSGSGSTQTTGGDANAATQAAAGQTTAAASVADEDSSVLTFYTGLGNSGTGYYEKVIEMVKEDLGIEIQPVFLSTMDGTTGMNDMLLNEDPPADIITTASGTDPDLQAANFIDLAATTSIPDLFTTKKISEVSVDGAVYQIPYTSRLIGIEYNKTLFEEMGWEIPKTFEEMKALKAEAEKAGYTFAIACGCAPGHGFNYLFHIMGCQYLSSPDGTQWLSDYQSGLVGSEDFAEECSYFEDYKEAGLFGTFHDTDWLANKRFAKERALFYYGVTNDIYSYDGFKYTSDGKIEGAQYGEDGKPVAEKAEDGNAVYLNDEYVYYDETNEEHAGLDRYNIPGAVVLHDEYGSMPWITEDGTGNSFTTYDNMYLALNKELAEPGNEEKLEQAIKVLEYMTSEKVTDLFSEMYPDGYVATKDYVVDDTRLYDGYGEDIQNGYTIPWYYMQFDNDSIYDVGDMVNCYIRGDEGVTFDNVIEEMDRCNEENLLGVFDVLSTATEEFSFGDNAKLQTVVNAQAVQDALDEAGIKETVNVSLMPYIESRLDIGATKRIGLVESKIYEGLIYSNHVKSYVSDRSNAPLAIKMTGAEIKELIENGFDTTKDYEVDHVFPYAYMTKGGAELEDDETYVVAVPQYSLEADVYNAFLEDGDVITGDDDKPVSGTTLTAFESYLSEHEEISPDTIEWE